MCWLYVPGLDASNSVSGSPNPKRAACVTWRGKPMQPRTLSRAWRTGGFIRRLSGLTSEPSTLTHGVALFIASLQETPASRIASPAEASDLMTTDGCLTTFSMSSIACGLVVSSGKTCRGTQMDSSLLSSRHWKEWATALRQEYSARPKLEPATGGNGCSSWPTRTAMDSIRGVETNAARASRGAHTGTTLNDAAGSWGTPRASDGEKGGPNMSFGAGGTPLPAQAANWGTPRVTTNGGIGNPDRAGKARLEDDVLKWPTPAARDYKGANGSHHLEAGTGRKHLGQLPNFVSHCLPPDHPPRSGQKSSGERRTLNPLFTEWLMGWPLNWTLVDPLSTSESPRPPSTSPAHFGSESTDCERVVTASFHWPLRMRGELSALLSNLSDQRADGLLFEM